MQKLVKYILIVFIFQIVYLNIHSHAIDYVSVVSLDNEDEQIECDICDFLKLENKLFFNKENISFDSFSIFSYQYTYLNNYRFLYLDFSSLRAPPAIS